MRPGRIASSVRMPTGGIGSRGRIDAVGSRAPCSPVDVSLVAGAAEMVGLSVSFPVNGARGVGESGYQGRSR